MTDRFKSLEERVDKLQAKVADTEKKSNPLDWIKTIATVSSTVVVAAVGIYVTRQYNDRQLEVVKQQNEAQILISQNKALADLIPKLGSTEPSERKFAATSMALYGKNAIRPLVATLSDKSADVFEAAQASLIMIGEVASTELSTELMKVLRDKKADGYTRAGALMTLARLKDPKAYELASDMLKNARDDNEFTNSIRAMGWLGDPKGIEAILVEVKKKSKNLKPAVAKEAAETIRGIADADLAAVETSGVKPAAISLLDILLAYPDADVRVEAVWALERIAPAEARVKLESVRKSDASKKVRKAAGDALG